MANPQNEELSRRGFDMFNTGDTSAAAEITAADAVGHDPAQPEEQHDQPEARPRGRERGREPS